MPQSVVDSQIGLLRYRASSGRLNTTEKGGARFNPTPAGYKLRVVATRVPGYRGQKEDVLARLRRIEGQVRGLQRLVEEETYCIDVLTQVAAVSKALQGVAVGLLDQHLRHCVADAAAAGGVEAAALVGEATKAIERLLRS